MQAFAEFDWQRIELPGRFFNWRIRGNPLSWLDTLHGIRPDLVVATSMVYLATIRALQAKGYTAPMLSQATP